MDVTVKSIGALERSMRVELPIEPIEQQVDSRLKSVGRTAKIKGFRPGKVPAKVVKRRFGKQVRKEVLNDVMQKSFSAAVTQEKLRPAGGPKIETEAENGPATIESSSAVFAGIRGPVEQRDPLFLRPLADQGESQGLRHGIDLVSLGFQQSRGDEKSARFQSGEDEGAAVGDASSRDVGHSQVESPGANGCIGH